jgi:inorganic pyrophosphatase
MIGALITTGAIDFLVQEYTYLAVFSAVFTVILGVTVDLQEMSVKDSPTNAPYTAIAFLIGSLTSILAGYIGMRIAVYTNTRTTYGCCEDTHIGFQSAFRGGQVLGFVLVGLALLVLELIMICFKATWFDGAFDALNKPTEEQTAELVRRLFELVAGYGLGGSSVALFGRVGGGIYTKAADVGADLVGKTLKDLREDDPSNPGTIADNVGDNVGDIAGMGADLFGSLAESTCAALVVSSTSYELIMQPDALYFPLMITSAGIIASFFSVLLAECSRVTEANVQTVLKLQLLYSTVIMSVFLIPVVSLLPVTFSLPGHDDISQWTAYGCILFGLWSGMIIGFSTEYYTSNAYGPTLYLVKNCEQGPAPNVIQGLALGYLSCIIPIGCLTATIGFSFKTCGMYGIGLSALGMLGSLPVALTIDGYGPIADNAGGIAEMSGLPPRIREQTDALDAAGNTTAAIGKGFAIGSACLVGLALFGAFNTRVNATEVDILSPVPFCGLMVGAMLPYAFSAMTMKAVGDAANEMMEFIKEDFARTSEIKRANKDAGRAEHEGAEPNYQKCISISTQASLKMMIAPGALVLLSPLVAGFVFGPQAVAGLLAGIIVSGIQVAISASNTGGAWDNCKKEIEKQRQDMMKEAR